MELLHFYRLCRALRRCLLFLFQLFRYLFAEFLNRGIGDIRLSLTRVFRAMYGHVLLHSRVFRIIHIISGNFPCLQLLEDKQMLLHILLLKLINDRLILRRAEYLQLFPEQFFFLDGLAADQRDSQKLFFLKIRIFFLINPLQLFFIHIQSGNLQKPVCKKTGAPLYLFFIPQQESVPYRLLLPPVRFGDSGHYIIFYINFFIAWYFPNLP